MSERNKFLQVRMSEDERKLVENLADDYGLDDSTFVRSVMQYIDKVKPTIETEFAGGIVPVVPKVNAPNPA